MKLIRETIPQGVPFHISSEPRSFDSQHFAGGHHRRPPGLQPDRLGGGRVSHYVYRCVL
jgi:hypothetical protein